MTDESFNVGMSRLWNLLLPGTDTSPAAVDVPGIDVWLRRALGAAAPLVSTVEAFARAAAQDDQSSLQSLHGMDAEGFEDLLFVLTSAYYMAPEVRAAIGYPGQGGRPAAQATSEESVDDVLLAPVLQRGRIYVPTDSD